MFAGKTLAQALAIVVKAPAHAQAFEAYVQANKMHKARWVRALAAIKAGDVARVKAYMAESGEERKAAWEAVKAKAPAKPAQAKPAPVKAPAKAKPAKPAPAKAKPAQAAPAQGLSDADVLRIAQLVANMLTGGKKVA